MTPELPADIHAAAYRRIFHEVARALQLIPASIRRARMEALDAKGQAMSPDELLARFTLGDVAIGEGIPGGPYSLPKGPDSPQEFFAQLITRLVRVLAAVPPAIRQAWMDQEEVRRVIGEDRPPDPEEHLAQMLLIGLPVHEQLAAHARRQSGSDAPGPAA